MNKELFKHSIENQGYKELDPDFKIANLTTLSFKGIPKYTTYFNPITNSVILVYNYFASYLNLSLQPLSLNRLTGVPRYPLKYPIETDIIDRPKRKAKNKLAKHKPSYTNLQGRW